MIMRQNYFLDLLAVDSPSACSSGNTSSTPVLRTLPALLSTVQIFSHSSAETASAQCPSRSGVIAASRKIIGFSEQSKLIVNFFRKRCAWGLT
jgi:hypothetical protein